MQVTDTMTYSNSLRRRLRALFSPVRLALFTAAVVFAVALNVVFIGNGGSPEWVGALSVVPLLAFAGWTVATDYRLRRRERGDR